MDEQQSRKTIRTFAWASFLNDFGSDMIYPIWPMFVTTVLGANMAVLGLLDGLGEALVSISQAISGYLSDRWQKRKVFIWVGYLCGGLSRVGYALSTAWPHLVPFRILDRAGKMRGAPRDAMAADASTQENRGKNFGILRTMDNLGAVFGIVFCILFINWLGYRMLFWIAAIPSTLAVVLVLWRIKEAPLPERKLYKGLEFFHWDPNFRLYLTLSAIFALASFSYSFLMILAKEAGFQPGFIPVLYLIFTAVASLFSLPFGRWSDRIGRKSVLIIAFLLWMVLCAIVIWAKGPWVLYAVFILFGLHKGALDPVQKTLVAELAPVDRRASVLGAFQMVIGLCALPASVIAGALWDRLGLHAPFILSLGLTLCALVLLIFVREPGPAAQTKP